MERTLVKFSLTFSMHYEAFEVSCTQSFFLQNPMFRTKRIREKCLGFDRNVKQNVLLYQIKLCHE